MADSDDNTPYDDDTTGRAVDDIAAHESDALLAAEDAAAAPSVPLRRGWWRSLGHGLAPWTWQRRSRHVWYGLLLVVVTATAATPQSRYWVLNVVGVRVSASVKVTDGTLHTAITGATVRINGVSVRTDGNGQAIVRGLKQGAVTVQVTYPGFATVDRHVTLGWGSNPLDTFALTATGSQYTFVVQDYASGKPVPGAVVSIAGVQATANAAGRAVVVLPNSQHEAEATVSKPNYRGATVQAKAFTATPVAVTLVPAQKAVYVSKENGVYNVYRSDIDGQNRMLLLAGTGNENSNLSLVVSPDSSHAALVSTRDNQLTADGFLLSTLTLIDVNTLSSVTLGHAEQIQLVDWVGTKLIFEQVGSSPSASASGRYAIFAYDYATTSRLQLTAAPQLKAVLSAQGSIYYASADSADDTTATGAFYRMGLDGNNQKTLLAKTIWNAYRTDYNTVSLQTTDGWYNYSLTTGLNTQGTAPSVLVSRAYAENPADSNQAVWVDTRNGQRVLLHYDRSTGKDTIIHSQVGLVQPIRWLTTDSVVCRIVTAGETADYVVSTASKGPVHKIADVGNTYGFGAGQ